MLARLMLVFQLSMAQYNNYVSVPHSSYTEFKNATLGNGYNVDAWYRGGWGNQCWDYIALLYWQYGLTLYTKTGGGSAKDCWLVSRNANARSPFIAVEGIQNIKRGDVIVTNASPWTTNGHICLADENYRTSGNQNKLWCVGQHQRGSTSLPVTRDELNISYFLGIFRNTNWDGETPPEPSEVYNKKGYNFILFNRRKRQEKWMQKPLIQR